MYAVGAQDKVKRLNVQCFPRDWAVVGVIVMWVDRSRRLQKRLRENLRSNKREDGVPSHTYYNLSYRESTLRAKGQLCGSTSRSFSIPQDTYYGSR